MSYAPARYRLAPKECQPNILAPEGVWINRTAEYLAKQRGETRGPQDFEEPETLILVPLPCWKHLSSEQYRHQIESMVHEIENTASARNTSPCHVWPRPPVW